MEVTTIIVLVIGLVLGGVIMLLYRRSGENKDGINPSILETFKSDIQNLQTELAVARGNIVSLETELLNTKDLSESLRVSGQQALRELDTSKALKENALLRYTDLVDEKKLTDEKLNQMQDAVHAGNNKIAKLEAEIVGKAERLLALKTDLESLTGEKNALDNKLAQTSEDLNSANNNIARLESDLNNKEERLQTQKKDFEEIKSKLETEFKVIAGNILDNSSKKFHEQQENHLKIILDPLKEKINSFQEEINTRYNDENKDRSSLRTEIKQVVELNKRLSDEASNLTNALKGNTKQQGDWGEVILESILEYVGLQKDVHYSVQESGVNNDGARIRPDVLVLYPNKSVLVVDSKVSLLHYEQYCSATTSAEQEQFRAQLVRSVKTHIDGLSIKRYTDLPGALDAVMMFVPIEPAFITAQQGDPKLWQYAYDKGVILLSPTLLLGAMKLVRDYWKRDEVNQNAQEIAKRAGALYDKLAGFVANMDSVGSYLEKAKVAYDGAYGQLKSGRGNLISQAAQLKQLGIEAKKELPKDLVGDAMLEAGFISLPEDNENKLN